MVLGDVLYLAAVLAGLAFIAETFSFLLIAIKWAGVVYLCCLAVQFWTSGETFDVAERAEPAAAEARSFQVSWSRSAIPNAVLFSSPSCRRWSISARCRRSTCLSC